MLAGVGSMRLYGWVALAQVAPASDNKSSAVSAGYARSNGAWALVLERLENEAAGVEQHVAGWSPGTRHAGTL